MRTFLEFLNKRRGQKLIKEIKKQIKHKEKLLKDTEKKIDKLISDSQKNWDYLNQIIK